MFPLSNWTELDVWRYIGAEEPRAAVDLLRARARGVRARRDALRGLRVRCTRRDGEEAFTATRALPHGRRHDDHRRGRSEATDVEAVIAETAATRLTERGATRADDRTSEAAMEDRKREGYF